MPVNANNIMLSFTRTLGMELGDWTSTVDESTLRMMASEHPFVGVSRIEETPEEQVLQKERIEVCRKAFDVLDDLEHEVLHRSFIKEESLVSIANSLGYSRCHISRVKRKGP